MRITITTESEEKSEKIYEMLTHPTSGEGCLYGEKECINSHESIPDIMEFNLNLDEIEALKKIEGVLFVKHDDSKINLHYSKIKQEGKPKLASYVNNSDNIPHSLYYGQKHELSYTHDSPTDGNSIISLSSIDCSNVDIIVLDSGIDLSHPDFEDSFGVSNIVQFDWRDLKSGDPINGNQIVSTQSSNYYQDTVGHGTACASLIAGKKCGFAKNAKIYSLRSNELGSTSDGFNIGDCFELILSFQKSKKLNLHGLNSSRPTILSNSWGYTGPLIENYALDTTKNNHNMAYSIDVGKSSLFYTRLQGSNSVADGYFRSIINEGVHVLVSAGNNNISLINDPLSGISFHLFRKNGSDYAIVKTDENKNSYVLNNNYAGFTYGSTSSLTQETRYMYSSPNIGLGYNKNDYPITIVGDIIPIGYNDDDSDLYWSAANAKTTYRILSSLSNEPRIITDNSVRYNSISGAFFIKSAYSSFGPDVDIYAPGNGVWAALSNYVANTTSPQITANNDKNERYEFFNGTSSSCPIVAGILATYLAVFPSSTPKEAREWLLNNGIKGNIMKTEANTLTVSSFDGSTTKYFDAAFGPNINVLGNDSAYKLQKASSYQYLFNNGDIENVLFSNRFFNSNNIVAQAYPLRSAVLHNSNLTYTIANTLLTRKSLTNEKITH